MANSESELLKESRKAAQRRTDKMYKSNKDKIASLKKDYKDADFTEDDFIKGRDSNITGIKKDIKALFPKSKKQRVHRKKVKVQDEKDMSNVQGAKDGGRMGYRMGGKCKLAMKGKGRAYGKNS